MNHLNSEKVLNWSSFSFSLWGFPIFSISWKWDQTWKTQTRGVPWRSRSKIRKITGNIKLCKIPFLEAKKLNLQISLNTTKITNVENALNSGKDYLVPCPAFMIELSCKNS